MAYAGATAGYAAGEQTNTTPIDYAQEATYGQPPATDYQRLRHTGESLAPQDSTSTPDEINDLAEDGETVLTGRTTSGSINGALSYGTYDDFLAGILTADWTAPFVLKTAADVKISLIGADAAAGGQSSLTVDDGTGKALPSFANVAVGDLITVLDLTSGLAYAGHIAQVSGDKSALYFPAGTFGTAAAAQALSVGATVTRPDIVNGKVNKTYSLRKKLAGELQVFNGLMVNQAQISMQKGQTPTIQLDLVGSDMQITDADVATAVKPVTGSPIMDVVTGFKGFSIFGTTPAGCPQSASITLKRNNSAQDTGMGHVGACGNQFGSFAATIELAYFFKDFQAFKAWQAAQKGPISVSIVDNEGYGYTFTLLNARIFNPKNPVDAKNKTIVTTITATGNPVNGGGTFAISRIAPAV